MIPPTRLNPCRGAGSAQGWADCAQGLRWVASASTLTLACKRLGSRCCVAWPWCLCACRRLRGRSVLRRWVLREPVRRERHPGGRQLGQQRCRCVWVRQRVRKAALILPCACAVGPVVGGLDRAVARDVRHLRPTVTAAFVWAAPARRLVWLPLLCCARTQAALVGARSSRTATAPLR